MSVEINFDFCRQFGYVWLQQSEVDQLRAAGWSNDLINKYQQYLERTSSKNTKAINGRTANSDSQRSKVYRAERNFRSKVYHTEGLSIKEFDDIEQVQQRLSQVINSKTWEKVGVGGAPRKNIRVEMKKSNKHGGYGGLAYSHGLIRLSYNGLNEHILLHELAHVAGNPHHDVTFRIDLVKLVSSFMGVEYAKLLKKSFRDQKLKMTVPKVTTPKQPAEWLVFHERMATARASRSK